jgi:hypothetical protein
MKYNKTIKTPKGLAKIESISISELGFVQIKFFYEDEKVYKSYSVSKIEDLLNNIDFKINE